MRTARVGIAAVLCLAAACAGDSATNPDGDGNGNGDGNGDGNGNGGTGVVWTVAELTEAIEGVENVVRATLPPPGTAREQRNLVGEIEAVAAALAARDDVIGVAVYRTTATAQAVLRDGTTVLVVNNRPYEDAEPGGAPAYAARAIPPAAAGAGPPGSADAVVAVVDGGDAVGAEVRAMLSAAGYQIRSLGGTLDEMRSYTNLGALYLDTHGATFRRAVTRTQPDGTVRAGFAGPTRYALETNTTVTVPSLSAIRQELLDGDIVVKIVDSQTGPQTATLGITESFIQKNWSFDHGVVMIHACFAGSGPFTNAGVCFGACDLNQDSWDPTPLRAAILAKGADLVVSFDNLTNAQQARPSILYFFDRMLGADSFRPLDPPARPFDAAQVRAAMGREDLLTFRKPSFAIFGFTTGGNDVNVTFDGPAADAILAPSIERIDVLDDAARPVGTLTLYGSFGEQAGEVEVNGRTVAIESWGVDEVIAQVPFEDYAGDVIVRAPHRVESNAVSLTEWQGKVTLTFVSNLGSLRATAEMDVVFRADLHKFRTSLDAEPQERTVQTWISPASEGTARGQGSHSQGSATVTWSGDDDMRVLSKAEVDVGFAPLTASSFGGHVTLDPASGSAELCMIIIGMVTVETQGQGFPPQESQAPLLITPPHLLGGSLLGCLPLQMRQNYSLAGDSYDFQLDPGVFFRLEWTDFQAISPPDDGSTA